MNEQSGDITEQAPTTMDGSPDEVIRDERDQLDADYVATVEAAIAAEDSAALTGLTDGLHATSIADLLTALDAAERLAFVQLLGEEFDFVSLTEVDEAIRLSIVDALPNPEIADRITELDSDDAVFILEDMDQADRQEILDEMPDPDSVALQRSLDYPEDSAGRMMRVEYIARPPFWTVGQTIDYMREEEDLPNEFYEIFVVDPGHKPVGTVPLDKILRTKRPVLIEDIMTEAPQLVQVTDDQEEVARIFERFDLLSVAVVDEFDRLAGVITVDDIVDVIHEEADEDMKRLAGVGDEEISDSVFATMRSRFTWLFVNLFTALFASAVIKMFDGTIEQMVALAVLMPIVTSLGGNAGTQTMTVAVRALAVKNIDSFNFSRVLTREASVALLNGAALASIVGLVSALWFESLQLGGVIFAALIINLLFAGIFGFLIPIGLAKAKIDPAVASSVFVTMVTDVVGFFAFLGLAAWWFGIF